jgi:hypothetical protein
MNRDIAFSLVAISLVSFGIFGQPNMAEARKRPVTITQRQVTLRAEVNSGQKSDELTLKEADSLRDRLTGITEDETKMKSKNGGKLSYKDEGKLEKKLNSISVDMQKEKLAKRTVSK